MAFFRFALIFLCCGSLLSGTPDQIAGAWNTANNDAIVEIYECGNHFCGKIIDLKEKVYAADDEQGMAGKPKVDRENPDKSKRATPIIGLVIMEGFSYDGKIWSGGVIYDPDNGKTYKCKITLVDDNTLKVRGFIGFSLLGRTEVWKR